LEHCADVVRAAISDASTSEPAPLSEDSPQYEILFDDREHHDYTVPDGPKEAAHSEAPFSYNVSNGELRLFQDKLQNALVPHGNGMEVDMSALFEAIAMHKAASHRFVLLLLADGATEAARLTLAQIIAEAWQAEFRDRELRDVVEAVIAAIEAGAKPTLDDVARIELRQRITY